MADYVATARSNYFKVKDRARFEAFCAKWEAEMIEGDEGSELVGFICGGDQGAIPSSINPETEEHDEEAFLKELATHLVDGWVAIVREIGFEKTSYLVGYTVAVNARGERVELSLNRIYEDAKRLGQHITLCER